MDIPVIDDNNWRRFLAHNKPKVASGYVERDYSSDAEVEYGATFPQELLVPLDQVLDRARDLEAKKANLFYLWENEGKKDAPNQNPLPYCHSFGARNGYVLRRIAMGFPWEDLSSSSIAGPITNYVRKGMPIYRALQQMVRVGIASTEFVKQTTSSRGDFKQGWEQDAANNRVTEFLDLSPSNMIQQYVSALLHNVPVPTGHNFMGHAMCGIRIIPKAGAPQRLTSWRQLLSYIETDELNSWGPRVKGGILMRLAGTRQVPDQAYGVTYITASRRG